MSDYTPRNPEAYYGHPLAREIAVAARNGRYVTLEGAFDVGRVVEEVVESEWLAERDRQVAEKALLKAAASFEATEHAWGKLAMIEHLRSLAALDTGKERCGP